LEKAGILKKQVQAPLLLPDYRYEKALTGAHQ
jgi:hypothetical protein